MHTDDARYLQPSNVRPVNPELNCDDFNTPLRKNRMKEWKKERKKEEKKKRKKKQQQNKTKDEEAKAVQHGEAVTEAIDGPDPVFVQ